MPGLHIVADAVAPDEGALALVEVNLMRPDGHGFNRFQIIYVERGDRLAEYRRDLGPREWCIGPEFRLVGGVAHEDGRVELIETVARLQDMADHFRATPPYLPEPLPLSLGQRLEQAIHNASAPTVVGPYFKKERHAR